MTHPIELLHPRSLKFLNKYLENLVQGRLWIKVLIGMVLGIAIGMLLGPSVGLVDSRAATTIGNWLALPGQLFLALVQMIVIPLVFASIVRGLAASEDVELLKKLGLRVVLFFLGTTTIAILIGVALALTIRPGSFVNAELVKAALGSPTQIVQTETPKTPGLDQIPQTIVGLLPKNPLGAMVESQMLQIVLFAIVFGVALINLAPIQSKPLLDLLGSLQEVCMTVVKGAMRLAPLAVFGLLAQLTSKVGLDVLLGMSVYVSTVLIGLFLVLVMYLVILSLVRKMGPRDFLRNIREVQLLAFSTSSSAAVMPISIKVAEERLGVRPSVSQFVVPLGATINMNGTALYQGVAAIFLAQVFGIDISVGGLVLLVITAVGASIGSPATPGVGIVILSMVLSSVGVPVSGIALIMGVDRILDMSRTAINVTGDLAACAVMDEWVGGKKSAELQLAGEEKREETREKSGEDVLIVGKHV